MSDEKCLFAEELFNKAKKWASESPPKGQVSQKMYRQNQGTAIFMMEKAAKAPGAKADAMLECAKLLHAFDEEYQLPPDKFVEHEHYTAIKWLNLAIFNGSAEAKALQETWYKNCKVCQAKNKTELDIILAARKP